MTRPPVILLALSLITWPVLAMEDGLARDSLTLSIDHTQPTLIEVYRLQNETTEPRPTVLHFKATYGNPAWPGHWVAMPATHNSILLYVDCIRSILVAPGMDDETFYQPRCVAEFQLTPLEITQCTRFEINKAMRLPAQQHFAMRELCPQAPEKRKQVTEWLRDGISALRHPKRQSQREKEFELEIHPNSAAFFRRRREQRNQTIAAMQLLLSQLSPQTSAR